MFQGWADEEGTVREAEKEQPVKWENRGCWAKWRKRFWQRVCTSNAPDGQTRPSRKVKQENGPLDLALQVNGDLGKGTFDRLVRKKAWSGRQQTGKVNNSLEEFLRGAETQGGSQGSRIRREVFNMGAITACAEKIW